MRRHSLLDFWRGWLDSLSTDGGDRFILFVLILVGIRVYASLDATAGGQIITLSFGALIALLKPKGSNREQMSATATTTATTTQTQPPPDPPAPPPVVAPPVVPAPPPAP